MAFVALGVVGAFVGSTVSTYLFHRPTLNLSALKTLGPGGLQGTAVTVGAVMVTLFFGVYASDRVRGNKQAKENAAKIACWTSYPLAGIIFTVATKVLMNRMNIPISYKEAFSNFGAASTIGYVTIRAS